MGPSADVTRVVTALVVLGDPPEETVASAWVAPVCVEEGAEPVALAVGVGVGVKPMVGLAGVGREPGEDAVGLSPVALGAVAVVGMVDVEGKPVVGVGGVGSRRQGTHVPLFWSKYSSWVQL